MTDRPEVTGKSALTDSALVDRRWTQRRMLRGLPDWMIQNVCADDSSGFPRRERTPMTRGRTDVMEIHLRDVADSMV